MRKRTGALSRQLPRPFLLIYLLVFYATNCIIEEFLKVLSLADSDLSELVYIHCHVLCRRYVSVIIDVRHLD